MAKKKKKKDKPPYDENGRWVEEFGRIKGAIRREFRLSPQMKETLQAARVELTPALKKDGTPGKRPRVRYRCAICNDLFSAKYVQVDHIEPAVPLWRKEDTMSYDELVRGIICDKSNLQVVCSTPLKFNNNMASCHKQKTDEENWIRKRLALDIAESRLSDNIKWNEVEHQELVDMYSQSYIKFLKAKEAKKCKKKKLKTKKK